jgi:putative heme-binding domain-containing protein
MLRQYDAPGIAEQVLDRFSELNSESIPAAMDLLTSRASWANTLLDGLVAKRIPRDALTAYYARQMALLGDEKLMERITEEWGQVRVGSESMKEEIRKTVQAYKGAPLWAFDAGAGKKHFDKLCAACHAPADSKMEFAPKLQGTGAKGVEYVIENVIDPNAVIGRDYQARVVRTNDGQVITGLLLSEGESSLTIRTATETIEVLRSEVDEFTVSENSFMPVGLLDTLDDRQRIELFKYLLSL